MPKPFLTVLFHFFYGTGIGFKNFGIEKSISIGFERIWYRKKYRIRHKKKLVSEVSDSEENDAPHT